MYTYQANNIWSPDPVPGTPISRDGHGVVLLCSVHEKTPCVALIEALGDLDLDRRGLSPIVRGKCVSHIINFDVRWVGKV